MKGSAFQHITTLLRTFQHHSGFSLRPSLSTFLFLFLFWGVHHHSSQVTCDCLPELQLPSNIWTTHTLRHTKFLSTDTHRSFIILSQMCHQAQIYGWLFNCYFFVLSLQPTLFSVSIFYSVFIPALLQGFTEKTEIQFAIIISLCLSLATLGRHCVCVCLPWEMRVIEKECHVWSVSTAWACTCIHFLSWLRLNHHFFPYRVEFYIADHIQHFNLVWTHKITELLLMCHCLRITLHLDLNWQYKIIYY